MLGIRLMFGDFTIPQISQKQFSTPGYIFKKLLACFISNLIFWQLTLLKIKFILMAYIKINDYP